MVLSETFSRIRRLHEPCGPRACGASRGDKTTRRRTPQTGRAESKQARSETEAKATIQQRSTCNFIESTLPSWTFHREARRIALCARFHVTERCDFCKTEDDVCTCIFIFVLQPKCLL